MMLRFVVASFGGRNITDLINMILRFNFVVFVVFMLLHSISLALFHPRVRSASVLATHTQSYRKKFLSKMYIVSRMRSEITYISSN